jgi:hypothetical protein
MNIWRAIFVLLATANLTNGGIAGLSKFMRTQFARSWVFPRQHLRVSVDHLCIDMNEVLHSCFRRTNSPEHVVAKIFTKLDNIMSIAAPEKSLVFAFDGPAPFAKLQTQRSRREENPEVSMLTPGTLFMNEVENLMLCYVFQRHKRFLNDKKIAVFISDSVCPGEGELKIVDWMMSCMPKSVRNVWVPALGENSRTVDNDCEYYQHNKTSMFQFKSDETVVLCGGDSDLLVQALCLGRQCPNTLVLQLGKSSNQAMCNVSSLMGGLLDTMINNCREDVALSGFGESVTNSRSNKKGKSTSKKQLQYPTSSRNAPVLFPSFNVDLVVLFALQGNDYLPKLRSVSVPRVLHAYATTMQELPQKDRFLVNLSESTFNFAALWRLMSKLQKRSEESLPLAMATPVELLHVLLTRLQKQPRTVRTLLQDAEERGDCGNGSSKSNRKSINDIVTPKDDLRSRFIDTAHGGKEDDDNDDDDNVADFLIKRDCINKDGDEVEGPASKSVLSNSSLLIWEDMLVNGNSLVLSNLCRADNKGDYASTAPGFNVSNREYYARFGGDLLYQAVSTREEVVFYRQESLSGTPLDERLCDQTRPSPQQHWLSSVYIPHLNQTFTSLRVFPSKKIARQQLAALVVQHIDPVEYARHRSSNEQALRGLEDMRRRVLLERQAQAQARHCLNIGTDATFNTNSLGELQRMNRSLDGGCGDVAPPAVDTGSFPCRFVLICCYILF